MTREVWFQLVDGEGNAVTSADCVDCDDEVKVFRLRKRLKEEYSDSHLAGIAPSDLTVFANQTAYDAKQALEEDSPIGSFGGSKNAALIVQMPTQRQVMVPPLPQQSFVWKEPKSLVGATGAKWDFQNSLTPDNLAPALGRHYQAWREGRTDKQSHPLFLCLDGPGTGKSRLLDEFPNILQQQVETQGDGEMKQLMRMAYTFKVTFENGTTDNYGFSDPSKMIGTRMLYQLQDSADWTVFKANPDNQVFPGETLTKLSAITGTALDQMCVILCVDSLQKLQHDPGRKDSDFYAAFASLCDLVNASKCWVIAICAATIYQPVNEFLAASPQWRVMLPTTSLTRPKTDGSDVFETYNDGNGALIQLLVDDMGGHGRALEQLVNVLKMLQDRGQAFEYIPVMRNVLTAIENAYPAIGEQMQNMREAFLAVISRRSVNSDSLFGSLTLDQVISCGLIRLIRNHLESPFILYMLLETHSIPWNKHATYPPAEQLEDLKPWQLWEQFNCKFRALKSEAYSQEEPVLWMDIHGGARFGEGCNRRVIERQLTYVLAQKRMTTKTEGFKSGSCSCGNDRGFLYQPADGSPSGDAFLCLEDATNGFFHEAHQYKCTKEKISLDVFGQEKAKAAGPDDLFIMYCTNEVTADPLPNSAFADATCWEAYYGPFAARAFFIKSVPVPCINTSPEVQLEFVEGVGRSYRAKIAEKRPFTSLEDARAQTGIPAKVLRRFNFNTDR